MTMDIVELVGQDEVWIDKEGVTHRLEDMDVHYRANLIRFLRRRAYRIQELTYVQFPWPMCHTINIPS